MKQQNARSSQRDPVRTEMCIPSVTLDSQIIVKIYVKQRISL